MINFTLIAQFHFIRPWWLLAILPLALLWLYAKHKQQTGGWDKLLSPDLAQLLLSPTSSGQSKRASKLFPALWLLAIFALAGPSWEKQPAPVYQLEQARVLLLDMSRSMLATDLSPNRLSHAKYKALDLLASWQEGQSGLIAYAQDAFVISPLTQDSQTLAAQIPALHPDIMPAQGSDPVAAIHQGIKLLQDGGFKQGQLVLFSDGIDSNALEQIQNTLNHSPWQLTIVGFGSRQGAPIKLQTGEFLKHNGAIVVAALNATELQQYCIKTDCQYLSATTDNSDIAKLNRLLSTNKAARKIDDKEENKQLSNEWLDGGIYLVYLALPLFLALFYQKWLWLLVMVIIPMTWPSPALAQPIEKEATDKAEVVSSFWNNQATRAHQAFEQGDYERAASLFQTKEWQATALYKAERYQEAADIFANLNTAQGYFNQGNSLAKLGEFEQAITAYDKALSLKPKHSDALANKALLERLQQKQQQQQQQQQQNNQQESQDNKQKEQKDGQKDKENQESNEQNSSDNSDNNKEQQNKGSSADNDQQKNDQQQEQEQESKDNQQNDQNGEPEASDSEPQSEQAKAKNDPEQKALTEQQKQALKEQQAEAQKKKQAEQANKPPTPSLSLQPQRNNKPPEDPQLRQLFRQLPDDPALLLRNRMQLEQYKRGNQQQESNNQW